MILGYKTFGTEYKNIHSVRLQFRLLSYIFLSCYRCQQNIKINLKISYLNSALGIKKRFFYKHLKITIPSQGNVAS